MKRAILLAVLLVSVLAMPAGAAFADESAEVSIEQPHYISEDVTADTSGNMTTYKAAGARLYVTGENFNESDVVDYGVSTAGDSRLTYNQDVGAYELRATADGTYEIYWVVRETRKVEVKQGNSTTTQARKVKVRYQARVRVSQTGLAHTNPKKLEQQREDAENWTAFTSAVRRDEVAGADADMDTQAQLAVDLLRLRHHPASALTGNFTAILLIMFTSLGGFFTLLLFGIYHYLVRRGDIAALRQRRNLDAERADLEDELAEYERHDRLATLEGMDWNDLFPDHIARAFRDAFGGDVLSGWLSIQDAFAPQTIIRDRLQALADSHVAVEHAATDGGAPSGPSYHLEPQGSAPEDVPSEMLHELDDPSEELVEGLAWDDPELRETDIVDADLDPERLDTALEGPTLDGLIDDYDVALDRDFDGDREVFGQYLAEFLVSVHEHDYCDSEGRVRPVRHALNLFLRVSRLLDERHEMPLARYQAEHIQRILAATDRTDEIAEYVDGVTEGRYS